MREPATLLETPRLLLRAWRVGDGDALVALFLSNRDRFADSFPRAVAQLIDSRGGDDYIAAKIIDWTSRKGFWFGIWSRAEGKLIGQIQLKNIEWENGRAELAYLIDVAHEGKGFISEAINAILRAAFQDLALHKLFLRTIVGNARSRAVAERFGFLHEGLLRAEFVTLDGLRVDLDYFGLLAGEYVAR